MEKIVVQSEISKKNFIVMLIAVTVLAALATLSLYKLFVLNVFQPVELMAELLVLFVLIERMSAKYTYEMDKKALRLIKHGLLGRISHEIPYRDIFGVYRYKPQLIGVIKFRRTYRFNSALDRRDVWTVAYTVSGRKGKTENRRFYIKPDQHLLAALRTKLPGKVAAEEQVIKEVLLKEENNNEKAIKS